MNQSATHEISEAGEGDLAVHFIVLPEFFNNVLTLIDEEGTPLRCFLVDCLCGRTSGAGALLFKVAGVTPIQNLVENLLFSLLQETHHRRKTSQMTMALLSMQLMGHAETLDPQEQTVIFQVLSYIETHYASGSLTELSQLFHYDLHGLSREIKRKTGKNYT